MENFPIVIKPILGDIHPDSICGVIAPAMNDLPGSSFGLNPLYYSRHATAAVTTWPVLGVRGRILRLRYRPAVGTGHDRPALRAVVAALMKFW